MGEGAGIGQSGQKGWTAVRLCNLVAQGSRNAKRGVQTGSRKGVDWTRNRALGDCLLQVLQESDSCDRTGHRDSRIDARNRQVAWVLPGDDLCGLSCWREPGQG